MNKWKIVIHQHLSYHHSIFFEWQQGASLYLHKLEVIVGEDDSSQVSATGRRRCCTMEDHLEHCEDQHLEKNY